MLDAFQSSKKELKETFSYHLWHFAAETPDVNKCPKWNDSPALDSLTWETLPFELEKVSTPTCRCRTLREHLCFAAQRDINYLMTIVQHSPIFRLFAAVRRFFSTLHPVPLTHQHVL
jgi:hypothetical protein